MVHKFFHLPQTLVSVGIRPLQHIGQLNFMPPTSAISCTLVALRETSRLTRSRSRSLSLVRTLAVISLTVTIEQWYA